MFYLRRREGCTDVMKYGEFEPPVYDRSNIVHGMIDRMSWLSKREKLDPKQALAIDFVVLHDGNFYVSGEVGARKSVGGYRVRHGCHRGATGSDMVVTVDYHSSEGYENLRGANPVGGVETVAMPQEAWGIYPIGGVEMVE